MQTDDNESLSVQNQLSYLDVVTVRSLPFGPVPRLLLLALIGAAVGFAVSYSNSDMTFKLFLIMFVSIEIVILDLYASWMVYKRNAKNSTATFVIDQDAIHITTAEGIKSKVAWMTVLQIKPKHSAITIQISKKPDLYYWIPLRRFSSSAKADHFLTKANEYWSHWLMTASLEGPKALEENSEDPHVDVEITLKELILCDSYLLRHLIFSGLLIVLLSSILMTFSSLTGYSSWAGITLMFLGVFIIFAPAIGAWRKFKNHPNWLSGRTSITAEGLRPYNSASGFDTVLSWESIAKIYTRQGLLFFELSNRRAVVVPLRCFNTKESADSFTTVCQARWSQRQTESLASGTK